MQQNKLLDQLKNYRKFISSYYVYEGIRITAAIIIPVLLLHHFHYLSAGVAIALGALCISLVDHPGPIHHRKNAMQVTILLLFMTAFLTGLAAQYTWIMALMIIIWGFVFSIIGVNGVRSTNVGVAVLFVLVLHIEDHFSWRQVLNNALLVAGGGLWYYLLSLVLHKLRPYKLAQQVLGDSMLSAAAYLRTKAAFYQYDKEEEILLNTLLEEQVLVHHKQDLLRELLFKTKDIVKDNTHTGRVLLMLFIDTVDLFERMISIPSETKLLYQWLGKHNILASYQELMILLANEMDSIGVALQEGNRSVPLKEVRLQLEQLNIQFKKYRHEKMDEKNIEAFISLKHLLETLKDIHHRIQLLHRYTGFNHKIKTDTTDHPNYAKFVHPSAFNLQLIYNNLHLSSNAFRHAIRVSAGLLAGYIVGGFLNVGHSYWILLTVLVILKPAYSLTKQRNIERISGTFAGAAVGAIVLFFIKDTTALLLVMLVMMIATYSLLRTKYMVAVFFMTIYLLIAFYLLREDDFSSIITDRVIDTAIGSVLAFIVTYLIPPKWEHEQINLVLERALKSNLAYYRYVAERFTGKVMEMETYKLLRKDSFVAMANLSDSYQRLLSEPKSKQKNKGYWYQLVASNHLLTAHIAALYPYALQFLLPNQTEDFKPVIKSTVQLLIDTREIMSPHSIKAAEAQWQPAESNYLLRQKLQLLLSTRVNELKTGNLETATRKQLSDLSTINNHFEYILKIAEDMKKTALEMNKVLH